MDFWTHLKHAAPHLDLGVIAGVLLYMLYKPPSTGGAFIAFIEKHFGDSIGFYILHLGIGLIVIGGVYPEVGGVAQIGNSLVLAAMGILKLSSKPGDTSTSTVTVSSSGSPPTPPLVAVTTAIPSTTPGMTPIPLAK